MKTKLIKVGNSYGVRLPKAMITECGIKESLNIGVKQGAIVITPMIAARTGWKELFQDEALEAPIKAEGEWEW